MYTGQLVLNTFSSGLEVLGVSKIYLGWSISYRPFQGSGAKGSLQIDSLAWASLLRYQWDAS